ncbi:hypothetical protein [Chitinophaga vietnamensis]|uniref:hypothetical protein n=1 Tax=Chitinophaga vietnamensis TaxID=2593957 RepID=UPI00117796B9|nr:hypothetical protein [Chitinophaga vietnamensis]
MNPQEKSTPGASATAAFNDPDCVINIVAAGSVQNYQSPNSQQQQDAEKAIAQLTFFDIWRLPPFRIDVGTVRLEVIAAIAGGGRTWQIDINGVERMTTIASADIQGNLATASSDARRAYVEKMARQALLTSLFSAQKQDAIGPCK